jgi:hypothetical protein
MRNRIVVAVLVTLGVAAAPVRLSATKGPGKVR